MPHLHRTVLAVLTTATIVGSSWAQTQIWPSLKRELAGPNGEQYFEAGIKGALLPTLKGTLISALVRDGLSKLTVALSDSETREVTLLVHTGKKRLKNPKRGTLIEFEGIAMEFTKDPLHAHA